MQFFRHRLQLALVASLCLNVFLVSLMLVKGGHRPPGPPNPVHAIESALEMLPPRDAAILRRELESRRSQIEQFHADFVAAPRAMQQSLTDRSLTESDIRNRLSDGSRAQQKVNALVIDMVATAIPQMSDEARDRLAQWKPKR